MHHNGRELGILLGVFIIVTSLLLSACSASIGTGPYTVGIVNYNPSMNANIDGFKTGMTELGYIEGENITYLYNGALENDPDVIAAEVQSLIDQDVDLLITLGTSPTLAAKEAVEGTNIPVIFNPVSNPVNEGIVADLDAPGGNVTGVQVVIDAAGALQWLLKIAPATTEVHVPHNPADAFSVRVAGTLPDAAAVLGVSLVLDEVTTNDEELALINELPEGTAILFIPSPSLDAGRAPTLARAVERKMITGGYNADPENIVFTYTTDEAAQGRQAAELADQILGGADPGDPWVL